MDSQRKKAWHSLASQIKGASLIAFDTAPLIYYFENNPIFASILKPVFELVAQPGKRGVISTVSFHEVMVKPKTLQSYRLISGYRQSLITSGLFEVREVTVEVAEAGADLRSKYRFLEAPDALIIATAIVAGADFLLTGDKRLESVKELPVIALGK